MKRICSTCKFNSDDRKDNRCQMGRMRWRDGFTLEILSVKNCPEWRGKNGEKGRGE